MEQFEQLAPYLAVITDELRKVSPGLEYSVWEITDGNLLDVPDDDPAGWILQVPDCWGFTVEEASRKEGVNKPGIDRFLAKVESNIAGAEHTVDITAFGMPDVLGSPVEPFPDGRFAKAIGDGLKAAVARVADAERKLKVRILTGVMGIDVTASPWGFRDRLVQMIGDDARFIDFNIAAMTTRGVSSYNHTKFLLVDGKSVINGGINWMTNYYIEDGSLPSRGFGRTAPVTDLDIALCGPAAASSGKFLDVLWTWACANASTSRLTTGAKVWLATNNDRLDEGIPTLYKNFDPPRPGKLRVLSVGSLGYGIKEKDTSSTYKPPAAAKVEQAACEYRGKSYNETNTDIGFMTVNPDAVALWTLISCAKQKIVLSQQDINGFAQFPLNHALFDVRLLDILAAKMKGGVKVRIVLSNPGSPDYSNISDIKEPVRALFKRVELITGFKNAHDVMKETLQLAPLRVSNGATWPNGHKYRLHTKVVSVDDRAFYIGSRNTYPDTTQDHGFIIEDANAAKQLNSAFLDKQWTFSRKAAIYDWENKISPSLDFLYEALS